MQREKRVYLAIIVLSLSFFGGCMPGIMTGQSDERLRRTASFDNDCPVQQVSIVSKEESMMGSGNYVLSVCGREIKYKRTGTVYHRADRSPIPGQR
jgi:hypothetical protein